MRGAESATIIAINTMAPPSTAALSLENFARMSMASILLAQARIDEAMHHVDDDIDECIYDPDQQRHSQHHLVVGGQDGLHRVKADARPIEDRLHHHCACH